MPDPQDMAQGVGNILQNGLGIFNQGITGLSSVLQSADSAVRSLDNSLTGQPTAPSPGQNASQGMIANQVVTLVRQGRDAATQANNPQAPASVRGFQQAMGLLLQHDIPAVIELADMMPSPTEVVRMGLRDLKGSASLARLAQGAGTMDDVTQVAQFTEELMGRVQQTMARPEQSESSAATAKTPRRRRPSNKSPSPSTKTPRRRRKTKKDGTTLAQQPPLEGDIALAQAVAEEMRDDNVNEWFKQFEQGIIPEQEWVGRIGQYAHKMGLDGLDDILERANTRLGDVMTRRTNGQS